MMFNLQDGHIHTGNLEAFLRVMGYDQATPLDLIRIIRRMDTDGDALVSYQEFDDYVSQLPAIAEFYTNEEGVCIVEAPVIEINQDELRDLKKALADAEELYPTLRDHFIRI